MKTNTRSDILTYIKNQGQVSPHQLKQHLGLGGPAIHRQLKKLEAEQSIVKIGKAPRVVYVVREG
jgi:predicted ArsR family transcriptional regulator